MSIKYKKDVDKLKKDVVIFNTLAQTKATAKDLDN